MSEALLLVTGSRTYEDRQSVDDALWEAYCGLVVAGPFTLLRVMHGNNKRGADALADAWAVNRYYEQVRVTRVSADWNADCTPECQPGHRRTYATSGWGIYPRVDSFCPAQGNYRNQRMVDRHPIATVALLWQEKSNGTWDCAHRSIKADIPTLICRRGQRPVWANPEFTAWSVN